MRRGWLAVLMGVAAAVLFAGGTEGQTQAGAAKKAAGGTQYSACKEGQMSLALDEMGGNFNGMSHSGVLVVLRNLGPEVCTVPARPEIAFEDGNQKALKVAVEVQVSAAAKKGMHPGPVVLPVAVPVGAEVTSELRWVSADVYDGGRCVMPAFVSVKTGVDVLRRKVLGGMSICGPAEKGPSVTMTPLKRDPVLAWVRMP